MEGNDGSTKNLESSGGAAEGATLPHMLLLDDEDSQVVSHYLNVLFHVLQKYRIWSSHVKDLPQKSQDYERGLEKNK